MQSDIKKSQTVVIFPDDPTVKKEVTQEVIISDNREWINILHDGQELSISMENFIELAGLIDSTFNEALIENYKHFL